MQGAAYQIDRRGLRFWAIVCAIGLGAYLVFGQFLPRARFNAIEREAKMNLHSVQLSVERFAVDTEGDYPYDVNELIQRGYLEQFPENPFAHRPMRAVSVDSPWPEESGEMNPRDLPQMPPGDFVYVRFCEGLAPTGGQGRRPVDGYRLVLF